MGVEDEFEEMRKMINRMLQDTFQSKAGPGRAPLVRASAGRGRSGARARPPSRRIVVSTPLEPALTEPEVAVSEREVSVTFDLSSRSPRDVQPYVAGRLLRLDVSGPRPLQRLLQLPADVEPEGSWTLRNGVFDLVLARRAGSPGDT